LRNELRSKKMSFKDGQVIWYTSCDKYTPDLIIGKKLIVEVDGKIHDQQFQKTPDRIRQRGFKKYGICRIHSKKRGWTVLLRMLEGQEWTTEEKIHRQISSRGQTD